MNLSGKEKNNRILVVDDEIDVLDFLKIYLDSLGWEVTIQSSISSALDELEKRRYFLILTDIAMPEMDGYELISTVKKRNIPSEFILMTGFGYNPNHTLIKISKTLRYCCLFKPFDRTKVADAVLKAWNAYNQEFLSADENSPLFSPGDEPPNAGAVPPSS